MSILAMYLWKKVRSQTCKDHKWELKAGTCVEKKTRPKWLLDTKDVGSEMSLCPVYLSIRKLKQAKKGLQSQSGCYGLSWTDMDWHGLSWTVIDCPGLS